MHDNNGFVRYNEQNFSWADQARLAKVAEAARRRGATLVVSNAHHDQISDLYPNFATRVITRKSRLARDPSHRREVSELLLIGRP
jgi:DNA adenine methylase